MGKIVSFFSGPLAPYLVSIAFICGFYFYAHNNGYNECELDYANTRADAAQDTNADYIAHYNNVARIAAHSQTQKEGIKESETAKNLLDSTIAGVLYDETRVLNTKPRRRDNG